MGIEKRVSKSKENQTEDFRWKEDKKKQATGMFLASAESSFKAKIEQKSE